MAVVDLFDDLTDLINGDTAYKSAEVAAGARVTSPLTGD